MSKLIVSLFLLLGLVSPADAHLRDHHGHHVNGAHHSSPVHVVPPVVPHTAGQHWVPGHWVGLTWVTGHWAWNVPIPVQPASVIIKVVI